MADYRFAEVERHGRVTVVTLNRPERMNALHGPAHKELDAIFTAFDKDADQWVGIVTGGGDRAFCAGNDLKAMSEGEDIRWGATGFGALTARFGRQKPLIAAVNGIAMGGGFEIALACDLILAVPEASFALPEPRVGLAALAGGLLRLPRAVGEKRAMDMVLTGRSVSAEEGRELGFVNQVHPADRLLPEALQLAERIAEASPLSIRASRAVLALGYDQPLEAASAEQMKLPAVRDLLASDHVREGPMAFAQKRKPDW